MKSRAENKTYKFDTFGVCKNPDEFFSYQGVMLHLVLLVAHHPPGWIAGYNLLFRRNESDTQTMTEGSFPSTASIFNEKNDAILFAGLNVLKKILANTTNPKDLIGLYPDIEFIKTYLVPFGFQEQLITSPKNNTMAKQNGQGVKALPTDTVPTIEAEAKFDNIPLSSIVPDPNQPRTFYDEHAMQELTDSIREKGVLQPILVRPAEKGFMIVCGERRFKAMVTVNSAIKTRNTIPAIIRNINDDEALELQIIENLQRKDVHPMEEAVAFKSLLDHGKDLKEIAARIGKSEFYARQRMKLNALTTEWQKAFFDHRIDNATSLKIALLDEKIQKSVYKDVHAKDTTGKLEINNWRLQRYRGELSKAPFDLADPKLNPKMGACTNCKFNSGAALLFPDSAVSPMCGNIECFKIKCDNHFTKEFQAALQDPEVIFVHNEYSDSYSDKYVSKLKSDKMEVLSHSKYQTIDKPELVSYDEWLEDADDEDSEEDKKRFYNEQEVIPHAKQMAEYTNKIAGGKFKKAFMLTGDDRGKYVFITLKKAGSSSSSTVSKSNLTAEKEKPLTAGDITAEVKRIEGKEVRSKQIDENRAWEDLRTHFKPATNVPTLGKDKLTQVEREAMAHTIYQKIGFSNRDQFSVVFKLPKSKSRVAHVDPDFSKIDDGTLNSMMRFFFLSELPPSVIYGGFTHDTKICMKLAADYFPTVLKTVLDTQKEVAKKRNERITKRIAELNQQKKNLGKASKTIIKPNK